MTPVWTWPSPWRVLDALCTPFMLLRCSITFCPLQPPIIADLYLVAGIQPNSPTYSTATERSWKILFGHKFAKVRLNQGFGSGVVTTSLLWTSMEAGCEGM